MASTGRSVRRSRRRLAIFVATIVALGVAPAAAAGSPPDSEDLPMNVDELIEYWTGEQLPIPGTEELAALLDVPSVLDAEVVAKAKPDECFAGVGDPANTFVGTDVPGCPEGTRPKVNQAYVWGLAEADRTLFFGTAPNTHCLVLGAFLEQTGGHETDAWACEFGDSAFAEPQGPLPPAFGDWRPARLFSFATRSQTLTELTPLIVAAGDRARLLNTSGIRSAGASGRVVLLGGPAFNGGINLFAFDAETGGYLGSETLPEYDNVRKWLNVRRELYTAVGHIDGTGRVLRWTGSLTDPFSFEEVGWLDSEGSELEYHQGHIYVTTWPSEDFMVPQFAGLWKSPRVGRGLDASDYSGWTRVWGIEEYEPDPVTARTIGGGALLSHNGNLTWGSMHVPFLATTVHLGAYGVPGTTEETLAAVLGTQRAISIFRGTKLGTQRQEVQLLYGAQALPTYSPGVGWTLQPNKLTGERGIFGPAGFGNPFNNYSWIAATFGGDGYFGTMDWSYLFAEGLPLILETLGAATETEALAMLADLPFLTNFYGADLWRFYDPDFPAVPESINGVTNYANYGMRTVLATPQAMYLGSANPMNLLTDLTDDLPEGGWELIRMTRRD